MTALPGERIGGWLIAPLAWLLVALLSASLALLLYTTALVTLLAVKAFAFSPVSDALAVRQLLFPLLATALLVPYFKRSTRVKKTFVNP